MSEAPPRVPTASDPAQRRRIKPRAPTFSERARAFFVSRRTRVYIESFVISVLAPIVGWLVQPEDPLFLHNRFSWLAVPPVLVALRHGFAPGVTSALLLVAAVFAARRHEPAGGAGVELLFGMVLLAMLVGQVAASTARRFAKVESEYAHLRSQFEGFSRSYALLELSHERLEQRVEQGVTPLRAALSSLESGSKDPEQAPSLAAAAENMLSVMAMYGRVQAAGVYALGPSGEMAGEPVATLGAPAPVAPSDALVVAALGAGKIAYASGRTPDPDNTTLLVAIPLVDARGTRLGVVAISALPFVALEASNLRLLLVVAGHVADAVSPSLWKERTLGDEWERLAGHLQRACANARAGRLPGAAMAFWCKKGERGTAALDSLLGGDLRTTDYSIPRRDADGNPMVFIVMPLTDEDGALAFLARIDRLCRERLGAGLQACGVRSRTWLVTPGSDAEAILQEFTLTTRSHESSWLAPSPG